MAAPKLGSSGYKGPVHEAVRAGLGSLGVTVGPKAAPTATPRPSVRSQTLTDRAAIAKGNVRNATASAKNKGTYSSYDPLSSVRARTVRATKPASPKTKTVSAKRK